MENKEYLSEERYQKTKKVLIVIGCVSLVIAVVCLIIVLTVNFGEDFPKPAFIAPIFIFGFMIPLSTFGNAFGREINAFNAQQQIPVAQEGIEKMAPTVGKAAKEIAKGVKEGLKDEEK